MSGKNILYQKKKVHCMIMQSTQHAKCSACILGLFCRLWQNVQHWTTHQLKASHQQRKSNGKDAEDFPFYGLWDAVFIALWHNLSRDAFHKFLCSAHCFLQPVMLGTCSGTCFCKIKLRKDDHDMYTHNLFTTHKIWFCYTLVMGWQLCIDFWLYMFWLLK